MSQESFRVDLTKIEGEGAIPCPKCGTLISPEDETEKAYTVTGRIYGEDGSLESVVIQCSRCNSTIRLDGFGELSEEGSSRIEISGALPESEVGYRTFHAISLGGQRIGHLIVEYAQKEDVKSFKRIKSLRRGEPFKSTVTIEDAEGAELNDEGLQDIVRAVKREFKGLEDRDIYIVEIKGGRKNFIGRASNLKGLSLSS